MEHSRGNKQTRAGDTFLYRPVKQKAGVNPVTGGVIRSADESACGIFTIFACTSLQTVAGMRIHQSLRWRVDTRCKK